MFERFAEGARQSTVAAAEEARKLNHSYIGTEHLLLGLLVVAQDNPKYLAPLVLNELGVTLEDARAYVAKVTGIGETPSHGQIPFSPSAKKVLELSLREALSLGHSYIGTEHILLGLVRSEGTAVRYLHSKFVTADKVRTAVFKALTGGSHEPGEVPEEPLAPGTIRLVNGKLSREDCARLVGHKFERTGMTREGATQHQEYCAACATFRWAIPREPFEYREVE